MTFVELLVVMVVMSVAVTMFTSMVLHASRQRGINRETAIAANAARTKVELLRNEEFRQIFALFNEDPSDDPKGAGTAPGHRFEVPGLTPLPDNVDGLVGEVFFPVIVETTEKTGASWGSTTLDTGAILLDPVGEVLKGVGGLIGGGGGGGGLLGGGLTGGGQLLGGGGGGGGGGGTSYYYLREDFVDARMGMPRDLNGDSLIDDLDHSEDYIILPVHVRIEWRGYFGPRHYDLYTQIAAYARADK